MPRRQDGEPVTVSEPRETQLSSVPIPSSCNVRHDGRGFLLGSLVDRESFALKIKFLKWYLYSTVYTFSFYAKNDSMDFIKNFL